MFSAVEKTNIETIPAGINTTELLRTNPASSIVEGLNLGPSIYTNSAALITWPLPPPDALTTYCTRKVLSSSKLSLQVQTKS